jgi:hypothetical protein
MIIRAKIEKTEYDFVFTRPTLSQGVETKWIGMCKAFPELNPAIEFSEEDGLVTKLLLSDRISTDKDIVLERLLDALQEIKNVQQMGLEREVDVHLIEKDYKPYDPDQIKVRPMNLSAFEANRLIKNGKIDLDPDFQRNFVWDDTRKSLLIESMLLRIPLPAFYFAENKKASFQVVDGLQRLTVISDFLNNGFKLRNVEYLKQCEGKYYSVDNEKRITEKMVLDEEFVSRIETTQLNINVIEPTSPDKVKYDIFYRINTGGRPLNHQEIRNCFAQKNIRACLKRMATSNEFVKATADSIGDSRMDAQEMCLRFFSFYLFRERYQSDMNSFLDYSLEQLNEMLPNSLTEPERQFYGSMRKAFHLFGEYSFRKCLPEHLVLGARKQLINKGMFVAWSVVLTRFDEGKITRVRQKTFAAVLAKELEENRSLFARLTTGTSDKANIEYFFKHFHEMLSNFLGDN